MKKGLQIKKHIVDNTIIIIHRLALVLALEIALGVYVAGILGALITPLFTMQNRAIGALWSAISVVLVTQATNKDSLAAAWMRLVGTFIGAVMSGLFMYAIGYNAGSLTIALILTIMICSLLRFDNAIRIGCITVLVVMLTGSVQPDLNPWLNASGRFCESLLGILIAIVIVLPLRPLRIRMGKMVAARIKKPK